MRWTLALGAAVTGFVLTASCGSSSTDPGGFGGSSGGSGSSSGSALNSSGASGSSGSSESSGGSGSGSGGSGSGGGTASGSGSSSGGSSGGSSGSGDITDASTSSSGSGSSSGGGGDSPSAQFLPKISGTCPTIMPGSSQATLTFAGEPVQIWAGKPTADQHGSLVLFWYETGGSANDVTLQFGTAQIQAVTAAGGVVASFAKSKGTGTNTGDAVWYTDDFLTADQVVACAIDQLHVDPRRIYTTGASAGALQATWMSYARSGYIAAAAPISGGLTGLGGFYEDPAPQDPSNVPAAMAIHGAPGVDVVVLDFAVCSAAWEADVAKRGGFSMDCNTGGGHVGGPPQICPGIWQFFEDHPFKVSPQPYTKAPLPSVYPSYCQIGPRAADGGAP